MTIWPQDYSAAWTLAAETSRSGVGLHSGAEATVELRPTDQPGFHMRLPGMEQPIQLRPDQVRDSQLCTTLLEPRSKVVHNWLSRTWSGRSWIGCTIPGKRM